MRLFVVLLLVALTAVRSWAGDVMAIQMAAPAPMAAVVAQAAPHEDCAGAHTHPAASDHQTPMQPAATSNTQDHCVNCATCQACFTVALVAPAIFGTQPAPSHAIPQTPVARYTSAVLALGQKPPIS